MTDENALVATALSNPADDTPRLVLADWYEDHGRESLARDLRRFSLATVTRYGGGGGYGDGGDGYGDGGYGGGYGDGGDGYQKSRIQEIADMRDGLYILTIPGGYSPYVIVGWAKVCGLEVEIHGARIIRRFGGNAALAGLAANGPVATTQLLEPSAVEYLFRPNIGRVIPANAKKWK